MHCDVDLTCSESFFDFLDEDTLIEGALGFRHLAEWHVGTAVTGGGDHLSDDFSIRECCSQCGLGGGGLHQCEFAAASADDDWGCGLAHCGFEGMSENLIGRSPFHGYAWHLAQAKDGVWDELEGGDARFRGFSVPQRP